MRNYFGTDEASKKKVDEIGILYARNTKVTPNPFPILMGKGRDILQVGVLRRKDGLHPAGKRLYPF